MSTTTNSLSPTTPVVVAPGRDPYQATVNAQAAAQIAARNAALAGQYNSAYDAWDQARGQYTDQSKIPPAPVPAFKWMLVPDAAGYLQPVQSASELVCAARVPSEPGKGSDPLVNPAPGTDRIDILLAEVRALRARMESVARMFGV